MLKWYMMSMITHGIMRKEVRCINNVTMLEQTRYPVDSRTKRRLISKRK